ncbi:unnamed protein product [Linum tenue]|uniref:Uncharacterized protein n=1 Tax=Linum tenue TaxID=586396 RepID=A0AAV0JFE6_9ROSI|nr:unnamed protein product [Linum tenue]
MKTSNPFHSSPRKISTLALKVSRPNLARALKLPIKKDKVSSSETSAGEAKESEEAIAFVDELVSTWMLLHDDDTWLMPLEIHNMTRMIKDGNFERLYWVGLIWYMVEKELSATPNLERKLEVEVDDDAMEESEQGEEVDDEESVEEMDFYRAPQEHDALGSLASKNLLGSMELAQAHLISDMQQLHADLSSGEFLAASRIDIEPNPGNSLHYGKRLKRHDDAGGRPLDFLRWSLYLQRLDDGAIVAAGGIRLLNVNRTNMRAAGPVFEFIGPGEAHDFVMLEADSFFTYTTLFVLADLLFVIMLKRE